MAAQAGKSFLLKLGDGATSETFTSIGALRTTGITVNQQAIDVTTKNSNDWMTLLADNGIRSVSISGDGIFEDAAIEETLRGYAQDNSLNNYELVSGNGDKWSGSFKITSFSRGGNYDGAETFSVSLESSGAVTFTAA